jgi:DNA adenine methylase
VRLWPWPCYPREGNEVWPTSISKAETVTKPLIPWPGGKRRWVDKLLPIFPDHSLYCEPFAGAAGLFFARPVPSEVEVLNDLNGDLVNLYRIVQNHLDEFVKQFRWALVSRQEFLIKQWQRPETLTDIQRAARFYYLQKSSFGGKVVGQNYGVSMTGTPRLNLLRIEEELSATHLRLAQVNIEHLPWQKCIERYDRQHTLFFMDPPYWQLAGYGIDFGLDEYEALAEVLVTIKGKAIMTIKDHPDMRRIFGRFKMTSTTVRYSLSSSTKGREKERGELIIRSW